MYKVLLKKQIQSGFSSASSEDLFLRKIVELPMAPQHGCIIEDDGNDYENIASIRICTDGRIEVWLEADKRLYHEDILLKRGAMTDEDWKKWKERKRTYLEQEKKEYLAQGWEKFV